VFGKTFEEHVLCCVGCRFTDDVGSTAGICRQVSGADELLGRAKKVCVSVRINPEEHVLCCVGCGFTDAILYAIPVVYCMGEFPSEWAIRRKYVPVVEVL
jgi:hypothetical protein